MTSIFLDRARDLRALIETNAEKAGTGPIPAETVAAMRDAGLYGVMVPQALGGAELDIASCLDVFAEVAWADGSAGWCQMAGTSAAAFFGVWCDDALCDRVFGDGIPIVAGQFAPNGVLTPHGDDWRLNGSYNFGSGLNDAAWVGAGAFTEPRGSENVDYRFAIMEKSGVEVQGGWDVMGLQSTASWDYQATDVDIPANATFSFFFPTRHRGGPMYDMGVLPLTSSGHAGWAIGVTRRALDELGRIATTKKRMAGAGPLRDSEAFLMALGGLEARARSARAWVYDAFIALEAQCGEGHGPDDALVRHARMATTFVNQEGGAIVREAYLLAGTSALRDGPLQRAFRDIHAGTQHAVVSESVTLDFGKAAMAQALEAAGGL